MPKRGNPSPPTGYKRPPRATRFKQGQSGNPKGRPKGSKNLISVIEKELQKLVDVTENGKRKKITKQQAIVTQLVNKAATGDPRLISIFLRAVDQSEPEPKVGTAQDEIDKVEDNLVIASIVQRIRQMDAPPPPPSAGLDETCNPLTSQSPNPNTETLP